MTRQYDDDSTEQTPAELYLQLQRERAARNFVAPAAPVAKPVRIEVLPPGELPAVAPAASLSSEVSGSYQDRAKGFQIVTVPIALAFGAGSALVALLGFGVPLLSLPLLGVFWFAFLAWWLAGWLIHHLFSADGVALLHTLKGWQFLEREQRARLERYKQE
jgi:hypothetical protein